MWKYENEYYVMNMRIKELYLQWLFKKEEWMRDRMLTDKKDDRMKQFEIKRPARLKKRCYKIAITIYLRP